MSTSKKENILPGDQVEIVTLKRHGVVAEGPNNKGEFRVEIGAVGIWVASKDLKPMLKGKKAKKNPSKASKIARSSNGGCRSIDLHGLRKVEAIDQLEKLLDKALLDNCDSIEIIHGLGTGALEAAVHSYLSTSRHVAKFQKLPHNPGTTIAYLK